MTTEPTTPDNREPEATTPNPVEVPVPAETPAEATAPVTEDAAPAADVPAEAAPAEAASEEAAPAEPAPVAEAAPVVAEAAPEAVAAEAAAPETPAPAETVATEAPAPVEGEAAAEAEGDDEGGEKKKGRRRAKLSDEEAKPVWDELVAAQEAVAVVQAQCVRAIPGGMIISYKGLEGFIPRSQFLLDGRAEQLDMTPFLGQEIGVVVIEMGEFEKRKFVCSRKKGLKMDRFLQVKKGDILEGVVTSITNYGVFVDLGGIDGLVHVSRLSKVRVPNPADVVKMRETVKVRVVEVDPKNERIALSMKEFTESPWTHVVEKYPSGSTHKGKVRNITDFGVYVQLEPGIVGMVHISDLSWTKRLQHPSEMVKIGQELDVKVLETKPGDKRIALSVKDTTPDPWPRLANIYHVGAEASGTIKRVMDAGAIVSLEYDIDCFVPRGKMGGGRRGGPRAPRPEAASVAVGDVVQVKVIEMDVDKKSFICGIVREDSQESSQHGERGDRGNRESFNLKQSSSDRGFTLGDIPGLQNLLNNNEAAPVAEAPVAEAPVAEAPVAEAPVAEAPVAEAPVAEAPVAEAPVAEAPVAEAPVAESPIAEAPIAEAPADDAAAETVKPEDPAA